MRRLALLSTLLLVLCAGCGEPQAPTPDADLLRLGAWMTGSFDSAAQARADPDYFEIHLHMARIWVERTDAIWLYVEQAVGGAPEKPYRQRIYRVSALGNGRYASAIYSLPEPKAWVGAWQADFERPALKPDELEEREGCTVTLALQPDGSFAGSTDGDACVSTLHGAKYATSEVAVYEDRVVSWDRGFDAEGEQIWGAEKAGYVFTKITDLPLGRVILD